MIYFFSNLSTKICVVGTHWKHLFEIENEYPQYNRNKTC